MIKIKKIALLISVFILVFIFIIYFEKDFVSETPELFIVKLKMCDIISDMETCPIQCKSFSCSDLYFRYILEKGEDYIRKDFFKDYKCFDKKTIAKYFDEDSPPHFFLYLRKEADRVCVSWDLENNKPIGRLFLENIEGKIIEISDWYSLHP